LCKLPAARIEMSNAPRHHAMATLEEGALETGELSLGLSIGTVGARDKSISVDYDNLASRQPDYGRSLKMV
jgi:hypothetical protein